jgi:steroid delta-isomerase-like uncharacterized protein
MTLPDGRDSATRNAEVIRAGTEQYWNSRVRVAPPAEFAEDVVVRAPKLPAAGAPDAYHGHDGLQQLWEHLHIAYPDFHMEVQDVIAEGDRAAAQFRVTGTNTGEWFGIPPSGKAVSFEEVEIFRFENGLIREITVVFDMLDLGRQLGLVPEGPPPRVFLLLMRAAGKLRRRRGAPA